MKQFNVGWSFEGPGYDEVEEFEDEKAALDYAREGAFERLSYWALPVDDDDDEGKFD